MTSSSSGSTLPSSTPPAQPLPRRGGKHPIFGIYVGGDQLTEEYKLASTFSYTSTSQIRSERSLNVAENALHTQRADTTTLKFNGKLELSSENQSTLTELSMEGYLRAVGEMVERFGLQTFFYIMDFLKKMKYLPEEPHSFTLEEVLTEHKSRLVEPDEVLDSSNNETDASKFARFKCYDIYELCDLALSRLAIESLTHPDLRAQVVVQYGKESNFKRLPGQVYLMMVLNVCHASFAFKLDDASDKLKSMQLIDYPGENVSQFANESQRLIKIMMGSYALPYQLGSQLVRKVCDTQSTYFNRTMFNLLDSVLAMEKSHGPHRDPKLLEKVSGYSKYGPLGVCKEMREQYADQVRLKTWPALAPSIPTANLGTFHDSLSRDSAKKNPNGYRCHICGSEYHLKWNCPKATSSPESDSLGGGSEPPPSEADDNWRYCAPADENTVLVVNGMKYYFCKHCVCKKTKRKGFYNRTHTSSKTATTEGHKFAKPKADDETAVTSNSSLSSLFEGNLGSVIPRRKRDSTLPPVPPLPSVPEPAVDKPIPAEDDPEGLEFVGAFMAECPDDIGDNAAWLAQTSDPPSTSLEFGVSSTANVDTKSTNNDNKSVMPYCDSLLLDDSVFFFDAICCNVKDDDDISSSSTFFDAQELEEKVESPRPPFLFSWWWWWWTSLLTFQSALTSTIYQLSLYALIVWWDTRFLFASSPPCPPRRFRRRSYSRLLWGYPKHWMLLGTLMLCGFTGASLHVPCDGLHRTWTRVSHLSSLIDLDSGALYEYNKFNQMHFSSSLSTGGGDDARTSGEDDHFELEIDDDALLDRDSDALLDRDSTFFYFNGVGCLDDLDIYFDSSSSPPPPLSLVSDLMDISDMCVHERCISCDHHSHHDVITPSCIVGPQAHLALTLGRVDLLPPTLDTPSTFPVIFDTGASLAISPDKEDFQCPIRPMQNSLGGLANGLAITGIGTVKWQFRAKNKEVITILSSCYYVPAAKARLISPQRLFSAAKGTNGRFITSEDVSTLEFDDVGSITVPHDVNNHLPTAMCRNAADGAAAYLAGVHDDENTNLTPSMKLLLFWHERFGHKHMARIQGYFRGFPFNSSKFLAASRCEIPMCTTCQYAKGHRKTTKGSVHKPNPETDGAIHDGNLRAGNLVSVDHFESRLKGRTYKSLGGMTSEKYVGGCIFVDSMSSFLHVEHQLGFSSSETIRAKQNFEKLALDFGVMIDLYKADNGIFKANAFVNHIREHNQKLSYCGVNAHHKNGVAERAIRTVSECARALMLHAAVHWKDSVTSELWPMAIDYAVYLYNHLPNAQGIAPADLFTGTTVPRHKLKDCHMWGCPVYVLDPKLQAGKKLPRWEPRTRRGMFVGFSKSHSSDVPLILNLRTGHISTQFHVVFDDTFSTVPSLSSDEEPPSWWNVVDLEENSYRLPLDDDSPAELGNDWLTPAELEERSRARVRQIKLREAFTPEDPRPPSLLPSSTASPLSAASTSSPNVSDELPVEGLPAIQAPPSVPVSSPASTPTPTPASFSTVTPAPSISHSSPTSSPSKDNFRRISRTTKGSRQSAYFRDEVYLASIPAEVNPHSNEASLSYLTELSTDMDSGMVHCSDPRAYAAKFKTHDEDNPSFAMAMSSSAADKWREAMVIEIRQLLKQNTWGSIPRSSIPKDKSGKVRVVLPGTWAFKLKRLPDGSPYRYKARYCVRGDKQKAGIDFFETYAPVVQWSTVRLLLTLVLSKGWCTRQVDYTNAFVQADLKEEVYIEPPRGFQRKDGKDLILKLFKSLYGLRQAPKSFFTKISEGLMERGFKQSEIDKCLFMKDEMICVVYVDDTIIAGPDTKKIEELITSLGIAKEEERHTFELRDEGEVGDFLGIRIAKTGPKQFTLSQTGLIGKALKAVGMETCNPCVTPCTLTALGKDEDGDLFDENWEYASVVGMLMYLATNSRPDIAYSVNQCARFTHAPKASHGAAVKRIMRYLQGTQSKGMIIAPSDKFNVDCYVDADFGGLWGSENDQDPISVKSRTGFIIMFMGCPLLWVSKLQSQIALSTMEAEYPALSHSMRELIGMREILKEIQQYTINESTFLPEYRTIHKFGTIPQSKVYEDNEACLKFATLPKMSPRTKHIPIPYHFFRSKIENLEIKVLGIGTDNQVADQFTKGLPQDKFQRARKNLMGW